MSLIHLEQVSLAFGEAPLLDKVNLQVDAKERIFLIGRNGMGKSTLLKVILGHLKPDDGKIFLEPGIKISELAQELPACLDATVYDVVADGLQDIGALLKQYHTLTQSPPNYADPDTYQRWLRELETVQKTLEAKQGWEFHLHIDTILSKLSLQPDLKMGTLSGGWQRRVALARALVSKPDLLLLDEPTNHLDLDIIEWLEDFLFEYQGALICITHDRSLLKRLSSRILELDRGKLTSFIGSYDKYLADREHRLAVEETQNKLFDKNLAKEETWIRQGIKARRTRNEGRVRALYKLREERQQRRILQGKPNFSANQALASGDLVIKAENITHFYPSVLPEQNLCLVKDFSLNIFKGDKIALTGPNGVGKTTLLKLLLGQLSPQAGKVTLGTNLGIAYFDQLRNAIHPELTAIENVAGGRETIVVNGKEKHVISYLSDFLFSPDRVRMPVKLLSGGECNRLLLAKLFSLPNNLLVLDEPTNDLDIESLELLEEILIQYSGTILLVSHDRTFIDQVATSTLYFKGQGKINEYVGGYKDIPKEHLRPKIAIDLNSPDKKTMRNVTLEVSEEVIPTQQTGKLSQFTSKMKRELEEIPNKIQTLEIEQEELHQVMSDPSFYSKEKVFIAATTSQLEQLESTLQKLYDRWEVLENFKNDIPTS